MIKVKHFVVFIFVLSMGFISFPYLTIGNATEIKVRKSIFDSEEDYQEIYKSVHKRFVDLNLDSEVIKRLLALFEANTDFQRFSIDLLNIVTQTITNAWLIDTYETKDELTKLPEANDSDKIKEQLLAEHEKIEEIRKNLETVLRKEFIIYSYMDPDSEILYFAESNFRSMLQISVPPKFKTDTNKKLLGILDKWRDDLRAMKYPVDPKKFYNDSARKKEFDDFVSKYGDYCF